MTTQRRRWTLDGDQPVRLARSCTAKAIADWGIPQLDENAAIAVSELATNACAPRGALSYPRFSREERKGGS